MRLVATLIVALSLMLGGAAQAQTGFDRKGGDYTSFTVLSGDPNVCSARCEREGRCRAWAFSYPVPSRLVATCYLKSRVTTRNADSCCVSGVKGAGVIEPRKGGTEFSIDRFGGDYKNFEMNEPGEGACKAACEGDNRCRAWTYSRPGYSGANARCYLKEKLTRPSTKPCCISGVIR